MTWTIWTSIAIYWAALAIGAYKIYRLEKKLEGKADKRKSQPGARKRVQAIVMTRPDGTQYGLCSACEETVSVRGHTRKQCKKCEEGK